MKIMKLIVLAFLLTPAFCSGSIINDNWIIKKQDQYCLFYTTEDIENIKEYELYFDTGKKTVESFFDGIFEDDFDIYIHSSRSTLDSAWQHDWNMPGFKSQCWMVASGISHKLDIISPMKWDTLACEHKYSDSIETQKLITHELVHVYHGQRNISPDFNNVSGIDWFIEGLAVYASGQCDAKRMKEIKEAIAENNIPQNLNKMWSGNLRYGLAGSLVMYIDQKYGREKLIELLKFNNLEELLSTLQANEPEMLIEWKQYVKQL